MTRRTDISVTDVARHARVSVGTVSRVINQHPSVDPELRRRVLNSSRRLGFVPRMAHRCMAVVTGRRSPALPVGYASVMTSLVAQHLAATNYAVELIDVESLDLAREAHVDGVIGIVFDERLASLREVPNLPIMTLNQPMIERGLHSARTDHYQQAVLATEHLLKHGHRRIGFLAIQPDEWGSRERLRGFQDTLAAAGVELDPSLVQYTLDQPVYDVLNRWVSRQTTAILNFSEDACLEVIHILSNVLKLRIGVDISTVTLEDLPIYQYLSPPQTTVRQPLSELARLAVESMIGCIDTIRRGQKFDRTIDITLPAELLERDSVADLT